MGNGKALGRVIGLLDNVPVDWLRDLRGAASQTSVALKADLSQSHLANMEAGRKHLTLSAASKLAPVLGRTADDLMAAQILGELRQMAAKSSEELDPRLLVEIVERLDDLLADNDFKEELLDALVELAVERLDAYKKERAAVATKTARGAEGTRDGLGRRITKPHGLGGRR